MTNYDVMKTKIDCDIFGIRHEGDMAALIYSASANVFDYKIACERCVNLEECQHSHNSNCCNLRKNDINTKILCRHYIEEWLEQEVK